MYVIFMNLIENNQVHNSYYCFFLHKFFFTSRSFYRVFIQILIFRKTMVTGVDENKEFAISLYYVSTN